MLTDDGHLLDKLFPLSSGVKDCKINDINIMSNRLNSKQISRRVLKNNSDKNSARAFAQKDNPNWLSAFLLVLSVAGSIGL